MAASPVTDGEVIEKQTPKGTMMCGGDAALTHPSVGPEKGLRGPEGKDQGSVICVLEPVVIAILGGDQVVGEALEALLKSGGYQVRFFSDLPVAVGNILPELRLVIFPPVSNVKRRAALLAQINTNPALARLPTLELVTVAEESRIAEGNRVVWPCALDRLKREIDRVLQRPRE